MSLLDWFGLAVLLICLVLSAFFSASETALTMSSRARMLRLAQKGHRSAELVNHLLAVRVRMAAAILFAGNALNVIAAVVASGLLYQAFGAWGIVYAAVVMTAVIAILCEMLPKAAAMNAPDRIALLVAHPVAWFVRFLGPVLASVELLARRLLSLVGIRVVESATIFSPHDDFDETGPRHRDAADDDEPDPDMLTGLLALRDLTVSDVMVHRLEMITVNAAEPPSEIVRQVLAAPVTRVPLWRDTPDNITGILHAKDLLRAIQTVEGELDKLDIGAIARLPWFVPNLRPLDEQLKAFRQRRTPLALVVDEYGEVMGLVTLEDILEEIVGDIADEHDIEIPGVRPQPDGSASVDGGVSIRDLNRAMDWRLPDDEATTVAGLVIHEAQLIPEPGQSFTFHGFRFRVIGRERNRITRLRVTPLTRGTKAS